jgi:hypothetical protein
MSQDRTETRVVLVKPGDLLLIGNVGEITQEQYDQGYAAFSALLKEELNIRVVWFPGDIDIAALAEGEIPGGDTVDVVDHRISGTLAAANELVRLERENSGHGRSGHLNETDLALLFDALEARFPAEVSETGPDCDGEPDVTEAEFDAAFAEGEPVTVVGTAATAKTIDVQWPERPAAEAS